MTSRLMISLLAQSLRSAFSFMEQNYELCITLNKEEILEHFSAYIN